jgi:hypothetical protein
MSEGVLESADEAMTTRLKRSYINLGERESFSLAEKFE